VFIMCDALTHRGPDDAGTWFGDTVGLGHRRLSIVDLGNGHQPMSNEDGTTWITFNGEIYNHRELRPLLDARGHVYRSESDTETIIHAYEEWGVDSVSKLRGMFAYAIWDSVQRKLVLARDRLGIKPLYYAAKEDGTLYFASEIKALIASRAVAPELNYDALADYAANRCTSGEDTLFRGVKRLPPGHTLQWLAGQIRIEPYWDLSFVKPHEQASESEYTERFGDLFRESVRIHLMSDVPLGVFLSGGVDSSAITAAMSRLVKEPIKTFSVAFAEREANELSYARMAARAFATDHHEIVVSPEQFFERLPALVYQEDEPLAHPSSVPLYFVSELARRHVKVVLSGEGSDELLAGYNKYRLTIQNLRLGRHYQRILPASAQRWVKRLIEGGSGLRQKFQRTFLCLPAELREIYFDNFAVYSPLMQQRLFTSDTQARMDEIDPYRLSLGYIDGSSAESLLDRLLAADLKTYLHELLMRQDQMSMAASLESRVPFLDHKLVEFATRLPDGMKLHGSTTKYVLRKAMRNVLPKEILSRKKMGFPVPVGRWLRGQFHNILDDYVLSARAMERGIFNPNYVRQLVARHDAGENHAERLWMLVNFEIWQRHFFDGEQQGAAVAQAARLSSRIDAQPGPMEYTDADSLGKGFQAAARTHRR